ncbi:diguanylate cyclase (GGDEF)-like protein [Motilibacter peucedani]|uniref:Diguanylate cyclase (GGDEF)-like protein n=1 Tax=Motilibacter peucedani TaxID=598650 RepID=A0A420XQC1_9ACTN|nr:GGDEF domain-containing protein [Motilibacter peucedani]RKS75426.1 diguanylate cyclase (GGDEF)-like protein [Motilibacter peucedani]
MTRLLLRRVGRPTPWQALGAVLALMAVACVALVVTTPPPPRGRPAADIVEVFTEDVRTASSLAQLRGNLADEADGLERAGALARVVVLADGRPFFESRPRLHSGLVPGATEHGGETALGVRFAVSLTSAQPRDLDALRWHNRALEVLLVAMLALAASGLLVSRRRHAESQRMVLTDPLTGVGNRRLLERLADRALREPERGRHHQLLLLDIDDFKAVNDTHGHKHGDAVLCRVADALQESVRPRDRVVRLGGDEFAVLLEDVPAGGPDVATEVLARLRRRVPDLGISGGGASWPGDAQDLVGLTHAADQAMYDDKQRRKGTLDLRGPSGPRHASPHGDDHEGVSTTRGRVS